jgi:hypothetical protein
MHQRRYLVLLALVSLICLAGAADFALWADEPASGPRNAAATPPSSAAAPHGGGALVAPANWPANHPLPQVASNCARCHLTAGRELTEAVVFFVHSVHDLNQMTCFDCHGGNREDDVRAHEEDFGFIGTKLSSHIKQCSECHSEEADVLASGPHHWDFSVRINTKYPTCIDCHGNHDIGNPPADFKLSDVCADCHRDFASDFPHIASTVEQYDLLWETMVKLREKKLGTTNHRVPEGMEDEVAELRNQAMQIVHASREIDAHASADWNDKAENLRQKLENWLNQAE